MCTEADWEKRESRMAVLNLKLYFAPDSCARVPLIALEEIGCPYELEVIAFMKAQHRSAEYLALNPKGKIPTLVIEGSPLTENVAILSWLADHFPEARLLPQSGNLLSRAQVIADLAYCASGLHPIVTRLRIPHFFCDTDEGKRRVFAMAQAAMQPHFDLINERLANQAWWYGDRWSIVDAYVNWVWFRVTGTDFDTSAFPHYGRHNSDMLLRPSVKRALNRSAKVAEALAAQGLDVKFSGVGAVTPSFNQ
jgi:glutathione S-transferase